MRVASSRLILLLTLLSGVALHLSALDVENDSTRCMVTGSEAVTVPVPPSRPSFSTPDDPVDPASEAASTLAFDGPTSAGFLLLLLLAAVTAAATSEVLSSELARHRIARPEWLALDLFVRARLDDWEELHWSDATGTGDGSLT